MTTSCMSVNSTALIRILLHRNARTPVIVPYRVCIGLLFKYRPRLRDRLRIDFRPVDFVLAPLQASNFQNLGPPFSSTLAGAGSIACWDCLLRLFRIAGAERNCRAGCVRREPVEG